MGCIQDPKAFLFDWDAGQYAETKLANVLFTYEAQRRLAPLGISVRLPVTMNIVSLSFFFRFPFIFLLRSFCFFITWPCSVHVVAALLVRTSYCCIHGYALTMSVAVVCS